MINKANCKLTLPVSLQGMTGCTSLLWMVVGLTACSSSTTPNYYSLTSQVSPLVSSNVRVIEVLPVGLADRLNRAPLVVQDVNGKAQVLDNERWTSTLSAELRDGLSAGLQQKLGAVDRYNSGMTGGKVSYRIAADFSRFDIVEQPNKASLMGEAKRDIDVAVAWTIKYDDPNRALSLPTATKAIAQTNQLSCRMRFSNSVPSDDHKILSIVNSSRQSLSRVVDAVAASVIAAETKKNVAIQDVICA